MRLVLILILQLFTTNRQDQRSILYWKEIIQSYKVANLASRLLGEYTAKATVK